MVSNISVASFLPRKSKFLIYTLANLKESFEFLHFSNPRSLRSTETRQLKTPAQMPDFYGSYYTLQAEKCWYALPVSI